MYTLIKSKKQYEEYSNILRNLHLTPKKSNENEIELLEHLLEKWENDNFIIKESNPVELLQSLMSAHNLSQVELSVKLGVSKALICQILSYKKGFSKDLIRKIADYFKLSQEAFNKPYELVSSSNKGHRNERMMNTIKDLAIV
jgi:HTH-type transcriptional regulator/antitoxin HigA